MNFFLTHFKQLVNDCFHLVGIQNSKVIEATQMKHEIRSYIFLEYLSRVFIDEHSTGFRYLDISIEPVNKCLKYSLITTSILPVFHDQQIPQLHNLLLAFIDVGELVDHLNQAISGNYNEKVRKRTN